MRSRRFGAFFYIMAARKVDRGQKKMRGGSMGKASNRVYKLKQKRSNPPPRFQFQETEHKHEKTIRFILAA